MNLGLNLKLPTAAAAMSHGNPLAGIPGIVAWLRADRGTLNPNGLPAGEGDEVVGWKDTRGNGVVFGLLPGEQAPVRRAAAGYIEGGGKLRLTHGTINDRALYLYAAYRVPSAAGGFEIASWNSSANTRYLDLFSFSAVPQVSSYGHDGSSQVEALLIDPAYSTAGQVIAEIHTTPYYVANGLTLTDLTTGASASVDSRNPDFNRIDICEGLGVGYREIICIAGELSSAQREVVRAYLLARHG